LDAYGKDTLNILQRTRNEEQVLRTEVKEKHTYIWTRFSTHPQGIGEWLDMSRDTQKSFII